MSVFGGDIIFFIIINNKLGVVVYISRDELYFNILDFYGSSVNDFINLIREISKKVF